MNLLALDCALPRNHFVAITVVPPHTVEEVRTKKQILAVATVVVFATGMTTSAMAFGHSGGGEGGFHGGGIGRLFVVAASTAAMLRSLAALSPDLAGMVAGAAGASSVAMLVMAPTTMTIMAASVCQASAFG